ncbi:MAG: site-2 protease family protein [Christensenellales bacterium]|jgi:Zn-dependent protease
MLLDLFRGGFSNFNLMEFVRELLLSLIPFLTALSVHEAAHAYVAYRCGDDTAYNAGRMTLNPIRHIDPLGFLMLFIVGLGWAKPVPVNPRNFKHPRRDDLLVSMAGIFANLLMCILGCIIMYSFVFAAIKALPEEMKYLSIGFQDVDPQYYIPFDVAIRYAYAMGDSLIVPVFGKYADYLFEMVQIFAVINLSLALFNLLPVPPLDGYHLLNHLVLKGSLFASQNAATIGRAILYALVFTGALGKGLSFVIGHAFDGIGAAAYAVLQNFL